MKNAEVCAVILAAGTSSRMGRTKQLLKIGDMTLLEHVIRKCLRLPFQAVLTVIGHDAKKIAESIRIEDSRFQWLLNENYHLGQSSSFHAAIRQIRNHYSSFMIFLGDQPYIRNETISLIFRQGMEKAKKSDEPFVIQPIYNSRPGHPVFFGHFDQIDFTAITGDKGAKELIRQMKQRMQIELCDAYIGFDIDSPEDYEKAVKLKKETKE